ncbi:hypothetical protein ACE6ED_12170 [Paenibacillus sp. CN-4]|uniref:hypothetical protein n=1 Tax=Paenibacillus nanchangensis TaxID=3348343 RepID=UPI00397E64D2
MNLGKIVLTSEEIEEYNRLKQKIVSARTRLEISLYTKQAEQILEKGRLRYISRLEKNNPGTQDQDLRTYTESKDKKARLTAYAPTNHHSFLQAVRRSPLASKLAKSSSGR